MKRYSSQKPAGLSWQAWLSGSEINYSGAQFHLELNRRLKAAPADEVYKVAVANVQRWRLMNSQPVDAALRVRVFAYGTSQRLVLVAGRRAVVAESWRALFEKAARRKSHKGVPQYLLKRWV